MTLRASKPAFNVREKLTELGRRFGLKGSELVAAETVQEARDIVSAGRKNLIINGNPIVYQRAQTASNIASYQYHTADRWRFSQNGVNASNNRVTDMSVVTNADIAGDFIGNYVRFDTTTAATSPASNASVGYNYRMEPQDIVPYLGKEMTISFYARSNAGIAINSGFISGTTASSIYFSNQDDSSTWVTLTSDWKRYTFTFTLGTTVPSTHVDIGIRHQPGIVGNVDMTGVQLEVGRNATEFEHRSYGQELALCLRYYWRVPNARWLNGYKRHDNQCFFQLDTPVPMRASPTPTIHSVGIFTNHQSQLNGAVLTSNCTVFEYRPDSGRGTLRVDSTYTGTHTIIPSWEAGTIDFNAEL